MSKLKINEDGTVTIPLRKGQEIVLEEPTMYELAEMSRLISEADKALGTVPDLPEDATDEQKAERRKLLLERSERAFSHETPHGKAMVEIINLLTTPDTLFTEKDLPGWLCHPQTSATIMIHFRFPLPGPESTEEPSE